MKKGMGLLCVSLLSSLLLAGCRGDVTGTETVNVPTEEILQAVRDAYGEDYLPNMEMDETSLTELYGLDLEQIEEYSAEMPMIGFHPDRVIIVKAKEGKGEAVEEQLQALKETLIEDSFMYPANIAKTNSAQVVRSGDYAAFLLVGAVDENPDASEEEQLKFAEEETQKAVDAFNSFFK